MKKRESGQGSLIQVGEMPIMKTLAKKFAPPTRAQLELIEATVAIREQPDAAELAFMARQLVLCTLPHSDPGNVEAWTRRTGTGSLTIQRGWDAETAQSIGYPYGTIPRLLLFWITTEVQDTKNRADLTIVEKRTLPLGRSLADFMRKVGLNPARGGKRGDGRRLHNQMDRLFNSRISFQYTTQITDDIRRRNRLNMDVAPETELWWDMRQPEQGTLWHSWIRLGEEFYKALVELPVPVDMRALKALKRSPLALDLYALISYRAFVIVQKNLPAQFISWQALTSQLGTDYSNLKDFKKKTQAALQKIAGKSGQAGLYPGLTIGKAKGGFTIHANRLAVPQKPGAKLIG